LKTASPYRAAAVAVFAAAVFAVTTVAQTPQPMPAPPLPRQEAGVRRHFNFPAPTNLQVLPKNLTGKQVHQIMGKWARSLGTHCSTCHAPNPNAAPAPNGHPHLDFALDIKPEKKTARLMVKMVEDINGNYVGKIKNSGIKVSCGTCHRGHLQPPLYIPPPEHHGPRPPAAAPPAAPGQ